MAVAINGILATMDGKNRTNPGFTVETFRAYLSSLTQGSVFDNVRFIKY